MRFASLRVQLATCAALAAVVRLAAFEPGPLQRADLRVLDAATAAPGTVPYELASAAIAPFDPLPYLVLACAVLAASALGGRLRAGLAGAGAMLGAAVSTQVLKAVLAAGRPGTTDSHLPQDAWPSGHTTAAAALAIALVLISPPGRRRPLAACAALLTLLVAIALVVRASHYPSDVLGGLCVAAGWGLLAWRAAGARAPRGAS